MISNRIGELYKILGMRSTAISELKVALRHNSCSVSGRDNSRYVFLGMFDAKAVVARILFKYKVGTGMQLQHSLGNAFSQQVLDRLFDRWDLVSYIKLHPELEVNKFKHIFVFGILGFVVAHYEAQEVDSFMMKYFVTDQILLAHDPQRFNKRAILDALCLQNHGHKASIVHEAGLEGSTCYVKIKDTILASQLSKSREYATKKAIEKAIKVLISEKESELLPYLERKEAIEKEERLRQQAQKHAEFLQKNEEKKEKRKEQSLLQKAEKAEKEKARKKAKANVKKAKERRKEGQIVITSGMNAAKRRRLEDKMK